MKSLDESVDGIPLGTKDAVHVPYIVVKAAYESVNPGNWVRFSNSSQEKVVSCDKDDALVIGIVNPFVDSVSYGDSFVVLLIPSITTPVRHQFEIDATKRSSHWTLNDDYYDCRNCN